jgi:hypothetical protein
MDLVEGRTGTMPDGTRVIVRGGKIVPIGQPGGAQGSEVYMATLGRDQAKADVKRLEGATDLQQQGYGAEATALQAESLLPRTPVGAWSGFAESIGKKVPFLQGKLGVPSAEELGNLGSYKRLQSMGALGDAANLKGPMSDKDVAFLKGMQYDPEGTREYNEQVIAAQKWAAQRQTAYGSALKSWTRTLGSPSAVNANGLDFGSWWGKYSAEELPPPGTPRRAATAPPPPRKPPAAAKPPVRVNTPQEAQALAPGTVFITPDGRTKVR